MASVKFRSMTWPAESDAVIEKPKNPGDVGVPAIVVPPTIESPGGSELAGASVHVTAPLAPVTTGVVEYGTPTLPNGNERLLETLSGVTLSVNCRPANQAGLPASVARITKV